jgi:hypothetical protein
MLIPVHMLMKYLKTDGSLICDAQSPVVLFSECDGVRLISASTHEFIRRVPDSLKAVYQVRRSQTPPCDPHELYCIA